MKSVLLKKQTFVLVYELCMRACLSTWTFYPSNVCSRLSRPRFENRPDGHSSNVRLLLIMSQNSLCKKLPPFFHRPERFERAHRACV